MVIRRARPDFRTINYFRGKRLKDSFDAIFMRVVELLHSEGFVTLEVQYIDGTKIESVANKYTFVWRGSIETYDTRLREKTRRILSEAEEVLEMESHETRPDEELSVEEFQARTSRIKEKMNSTDVPKKIKKAVTDSMAHVHYDKANQPGVSNLMSIYSAISGKTFEEIETMYDGQGYGTFKKDVADLVVEELSPIRSRYDELTGTPELDAILDDGAVRARAKARVTYENAIHAMGLYRK